MNYNQIKKIRSKKPKPKVMWKKLRKEKLKHGSENYAETIKKTI